MNFTRDSGNSLYCFPHLRNSCMRAERHVVTKVVMYSVLLVLILVTVFGNLFVIISVCLFKQLQSPTNFIILSLALADCLLGCLVLPYSMMRSVEGCWYLGETVCTLHSSLDIALCIASMLHVCLISGDRYWAICDPLRYGGHSTALFVTCSITITWMCSIALSFGLVVSKTNVLGMETLVENLCVGACVVLFNRPWGVIIPLMTFFIPATVMVSIYLKIFYVARRHVQSMNSQDSYQREKKASKTLSFVVGVFLLCWLPVFFNIIINPFLKVPAPVIIYDVLGWVAYFNSVCNPLIYGLFYPRFQKAFKIILNKEILYLLNLAQYLATML
ncbi:trace amine-associated receptor 13c-like [Denticeps clupeoides]|uniref:trace amine-associated receptor 13c-like n=1 Tax=Denticeps clupeoides TaxID=299321 RepID=UPI0010A43A8E|nr:trace amine-associated receptor 13c-like [Denticeps clupeoides]